MIFYLRRVLLRSVFVHQLRDFTLTTVVETDAKHYNRDDDYGENWQAQLHD